MAAKKKVTKKRVSVEDSAMSNLYVNLSDIKTRRKNLLYALKYSLIVQEEYEKITDIRAEKVEVLSEIKKSIEGLNRNYQKIKKALPNVKNVLSYTEKELKDLESQVEMIKGDIRNKKETINTEEHIIDNLKSSMNLKEAKKVAGFVEESKKEDLTPKKQAKKKVHKKVAPVTKLDRIKNNLKIIESKLGDL